MYNGCGYIRMFQNVVNVVTGTNYTMLNHSLMNLFLRCPMFIRFVWKSFNNLHLKFIDGNVKGIITSIKVTKIYILLFHFLYLLIRKNFMRISVEKNAIKWFLCNITLIISIHHTHHTDINKEKIVMHSHYV